MLNWSFKVLWPQLSHYIDASVVLPNQLYEINEKLSGVSGTIVMLC